MEMMGWGRGSEQEVKMSEKKEAWRKWKAEIFEPAQCLLSVRLASVAHGRAKKDSIVRRPGWVVRLGRRIGQFVTRPYWGAPREGNQSGHPALTSVSCSLNSQTVSQLRQFPTQTLHFNSLRFQEFSLLTFQHLFLLSSSHLESGNLFPPCY